MNLLREPLIGVDRAVGVSGRVGLPALYEGLARDELVGFPALRPHQRHPWHALLVQLGAIACLNADLDVPPKTAAEWMAILRGLTPDSPDDEPWRLVSPDDKPAFLQSPVGPAASLKALSTPDELDMLVTAKNHDLKGARMSDAAPDDWLFALVALQTSEGFLGAGNFGVSRMNGGFANRPGVGLAPPGGIGAHVFRDIRRLIAEFDRVLDRHEEYEPDGLALLWLQPWDGETSISRRKLHPYYIENCRRVRLVERDGRLEARAGNSKAMRVFMAKEEGGITGDPWTPIRSDERGRRALTVDARGFDYRQLSRIIFAGRSEKDQDTQPALLQLFGPDEGGDGWSLLCRAITRGQGKTEGYHERRVLIPASAQGRRKEGDLSAFAELANNRIAEARIVLDALQYALKMLFQNGPLRDKDASSKLFTDRKAFDFRDPSSSRRAEIFLSRFQGEIDADFFVALFHEAEAEEQVGREARRAEWLRSLIARGQEILRIAKDEVPLPIMRQHRALVRAEDAFRGAVFGAKEFSIYFKKVSDVA